MWGSTRCLKEMLKFRSVDKVGQTSAGQSPLFQAVNNNQLDAVKWLVERRDIEGKELTNLPVYDLEECTKDGRTPLWQAAYKGYRPIVE
jgi:ankyrin repeat protein